MAMQPPEVDRITQILQSKAPAPQQDPQMDFANAIAAFQAQNGVSPAQNQSYAQMGQQPSKLDQLNAEIQAGNPRVAPLQRSVALVAGNDPARQEQAKQAIIDYPDDIDPSNTYQVMQALAQWKRRSPEQIAMQDVGNIVAGKGTDFFGLQREDEKQLASLEASAALAQKRTTGGGGSSVFNQVMSAIDSDPQLKSLPTIEKIRLAQSKVGTNLTIDPATGEVKEMAGAPEGLGALSQGTEAGKQRAELAGEPLTAEATQLAKNAADRQNTLEKKAVGATSSNQMLDIAEELLPKATGSYAGTAVNIGKRVIGYSDEATQTNKKLKTLSGWLTSNVPRMEGPQSNYDIQVYMQMASDVGDTTVPYEDRLAALQTLRELNNKYTGGVAIPSGGAPSGGNSGWSIRKK